MDILVYTDWTDLDGPALMGSLSVAHTKGRRSFRLHMIRVGWIKARRKMLTTICNSSPALNTSLFQDCRK